MTRLATERSSACASTPSTTCAIAAMEDLRRATRPATTAPYQPARRATSGASCSCPLYRRVPWEVKQKAMRALRMTAESNGWTPPAREPGRPWRPPQR